MTKELRTPLGKLVESFKVLATNKDVVKDTHGNISARTDKNEMYIKASGVPYEDCTQDSLVRVNWGDYNEVVDSSHDMKPSVDYPHHRIIYQEFWKIGGICHTHSPYATAFAIAGRDIKCCSTEQADYFGGDIPCLMYQDLHSWSGGVVSFLKKNMNKAVLLERHGVLTFAEDALEATRLAIEVENIAQKNMLALQLGSWRVQRMHDVEIVGWNLRYNTVYGQDK